MLCYHAPVYKVLLIVLALYIIFSYLKQSYLKNKKTNLAVNKLMSSVAELEISTSAANTQEAIVTEQTFIVNTVKEVLIFRSYKPGKTAFNG